MKLKQISALLTVLMLALGSMTTSVYAAEEGTKSMYCDDGSLCVPEGDPEPECD